MSAETKNIFKFLSETYDGRYMLNTIFHTFEMCSKDKSHDRSLVNSNITCINFDKLNEWIHGYNLPQSADSMTFSDRYVYFIEFKAGDQVGHEKKRDKLIRGVIGKINDSDDTLHSCICSRIEGFNADNIKTRFYLVVDTKEMGIFPLAAALASLSEGPSTVADPHMAQLIQYVLPNLKAEVDHPEHFDDINIWYSDLFDRYLLTHHIHDIDKLFVNDQE